MTASSKSKIKEDIAKVKHLLSKVQTRDQATVEHQKRQLDDKDTLIQALKSELDAERAKSQSQGSTSTQGSVFIPEDLSDISLKGK